MKRPSYSSSSNSQRKCAPAPPPATAAPGRTKNQTGRSPLRHLNGVVCHSRSSNASSSSCSSSSTTSIEAPRGCLRFFLSHSSSTKNGPNRACAATRTPKSAPAKPSKFDLQCSRAAKMANLEISRAVKQQKLKRSPHCLYQWQSAKMSASRTGKKCSGSSEADGNVAGEFPSSSEALKQERIELDSAGNGHATATPISKRSGGVEIGCASDKNVEENHSSGKIKTPPIQASVSPEIQCGSGLMNYSGTITSTGATADTGPCFSAGYVVSVKQEQIQLDSAGNGHATATPISKRSGRVETGCASDKNVEENHSSSKVKTPPIQASVSPEIQCGSGLMNYSGTITSTGATADTGPCFGAGYVVSGVADRRKCRPRGILSVRENESESSISPSYCNDDDEGFSGVADKPSISPVPLPCEASVHWLLSPCNEEDEEQKDYSDNESCPFERFEEEGSGLCSLTSPSSGPVFSSDAGNKSNMTGKATGADSDCRGRNLEATTLRGLLEFDGFFRPLQCNGDVCSPTEMTPIWKDFSSKEERKLSYDVDRQDDPLTVDSLGSGNVIQTPNSDSSSDGYFRLLWANASHGRKDQTGSEIDLLTQSFSNATLSPDYSRSTWDPTNLNFRLDCRAMPSNPIDLAQVQNVLDSKVYLASNSSIDNLSQSNLRISWRDGLVNRIFEMDEYDFCKCMSDDEDATGSHIDLELHRSPAHSVNIQNSAAENVSDNNTSGLNHFVDEKQETGQKVEDMHSPKKQSELAESISFDGGGLLASASSDSDWNLCYKNSLFK